MGMTSEGQQQVDSERPVARPAGRVDLFPQVAGSEDPDRSEAAGRRDGRGEFVPGQAAAHAGLNDRQLHSEPLQEGAHAISMARPGDSCEHR